MNSDSVVGRRLGGQHIFAPKPRLACAFVFGAAGQKQAIQDDDLRGQPSDATRQRC